MALHGREPKCTNNHEAYRRMLENKGAGPTPCPSCGWEIRPRPRPEKMLDDFCDKCGADLAPRRGRRYLYKSMSGNGNLHTVKGWLNNAAIMFGPGEWEFVAFDGSGGNFTVIVRQEVP